MKKIILVAAIVLGLIGLVALLLLGRPAPTINGPFKLVASNVQQPQMVGDDFYYFTGSSFAKINSTTNKTELLSQYFYSSGEILPAHYDKSSVVFGTSGTDQNDLFGATLIKAGRGASEGAWWYYDFDSKQISLIDFAGANQCLDMIQSSNDLYCVFAVDGSANQTRISKYNKLTGKLESIYSSDYRLSELQVRDGKLFFIETSLNDSDKLLTYVDGKTTTVYQSPNRIGYGLSGSQIMIDELAGKKASRSHPKDVDNAESTKHKLVLLDHAGKQLSSKAAKKGVGQISSSVCCLVFASGGESEIVVAENSKLSKFNLEELNDGAVWDVSGIYYYSKGSDLFVNKIVPETRSGFDVTDEINNTPNKFYIGVVEDGSNQVYVNDSSKDFNGNAMSVHNYLVSKGFDPNQFRFNWDINLLPEQNISAGQVNIID